MSGASIDGLGFPEALRWRDGALWFSDMFRSRVLRWVPGSAPEVMLDPDHGGPAQPGGLGWLPDGTLLVVDCLERRLLALAPGAASTHVHADLTRHIDRPANDLHVDIDGTAWVGSYGFDPEAEEPRPVALVRVALDGSAVLTERTFIFPNGMERAADGSLVVAETFADRLTRMSPDMNATRAIPLEPGSGPDGLSIAPDGTVYVALAFAGALVAVAPGPDADRDPPPHLVYRPEPIAAGPGTGRLGVYDCAVTPDGRSIAVAMASADEALAMQIDTGRINIIGLPRGQLSKV